MTGPVTLYNTLSEMQESIEPLDDDTVRMFVCGVTEYDDDLNTPEALAVIFELVSVVNSALDENAYADADVAAAQDVLETADQTLAVIPSTHDGPADPERLVTAIVEARDELRSRGEFELADSLRASLADAGVRLEENDDVAVSRGLISTDGTLKQHG